MRVTLLLLLHHTLLGLVHLEKASFIYFQGLVCSGLPTGHAALKCRVRLAVIEGWTHDARTVRILQINIPHHIMLTFSPLVVRISFFTFFLGGLLLQSNRLFFHPFYVIVICGAHHFSHLFLFSGKLCLIFVLGPLLVVPWRWAG